MRIVLPILALVIVLMLTLHYNLLTRTLADGVPAEEYVSLDDADQLDFGPISQQSLQLARSQIDEAFVVLPYDD